MTLDQMADRIAGSASSPGEFLVRKQDALHYLNAVRCEGMEAAAKIVTDAAMEVKVGKTAVTLAIVARRIRESMSSPQPHDWRGT